MTPDRSWRLRYVMSCNQFNSGSIDVVEFSEALYRLGFRRKEITYEIFLHKPKPPVNPGFRSGLAQDTRY